MDKKTTDHGIFRQELRGTTPEPTYGGALSFIRRKYTNDMTGVDVAVTGVPLDTATTNRPGARFGPRAIRAASTIMAWEKPYGMDFEPVDVLAVVDSGDCFFDHGRPEATPGLIEQHAYGIIEQGPGLLALGVLIFAGLTAYDTQRLKREYDYLRGTEFAGKAVIMGALSLYLDFINMFLFLLRFMGSRE